MPSKPVYCRSCKGHGELYEQVIVRWGDQRIKSRGSVLVVPCKDCAGTGYIAAKARLRPKWVYEGEVTEPLPKPESHAAPARPAEGDLEL